VPDADGYTPVTVPIVRGKALKYPDGAAELRQHGEFKAYWSSLRGTAPEDVTFAWSPRGTLTARWHSTGQGRSEVGRRPVRRPEGDAPHGLELRVP
jgi:hypothetical protein